MYELQFIKIPKPFKKNVSTKKRYDLREANRRYIRTTEAYELEGERLEIDLLDVSTNEAYQFDLYVDLESDLLELIIKHLSESTGPLDEKDIEKVEALKQKIMNEFLVSETPDTEASSYVEFSDATEEEVVKEPEMLVDAFDGTVVAESELPEEIVKIVEDINSQQESEVSEEAIPEVVPYQELGIPEETVEEIVQRQEALMPKEIIPEVAPQPELEVVTETFESLASVDPVLNQPELEGAVDLSEYLDAADFAALVKLRKLQVKVDEKINWSPEELFGFFSFINSEEISADKKKETLLTYDFSVDLKNLKVEIASLIDALEKQAKEELELRYQQSLEDTHALLNSAKTAREKVLMEQLYTDEKRFKDEVERTLTIEVDQLKAQQEDEIQRLKSKHLNEASDLEARQQLALQTSCQNFNREKMEELEHTLDFHLKTELVNIQASQNEELQNYKRALNQEQLNASTGRIERLQVGERKIVETLFNVLKFNVLKQEDSNFQENYNPYAEQELPSLRPQPEPNYEPRRPEAPARHHNPAPAFDQTVAIEQERRLEELRLQNQLLESKLNTPVEAKTSGNSSLGNSQKKWWIGGGVVLLVGAGAAAALALNNDSAPAEPSYTAQHPTAPLQVANNPNSDNGQNSEERFLNYLEAGSYTDAMTNHPEHAAELVSYLFERGDADSLREVLELGIMETLHGLLNLAILESQYEIIVYEFERMSVEDRRELNSRQQAGVLHAYTELGREPVDF